MMFAALAIALVVAIIIIYLSSRAIKRKSPLPPILIVYSAQCLETITNNFTQELGRGGFGKVFKGVRDGLRIAVKVLHRNLSDQIIKEQFKAEVNSIRITQHPNLVRLYGFCFEEDLKALVYEFMENGSLSEFLFDSKKKNSVGFKQLLSIAIGIAKGIAYLHEDAPDQIIHYDIKAGNILLDKHLRPKVSDFGLAKLYRRDITHHSNDGHLGTPGYAAPELWDPTVPVNDKCDVYSFGILLFEILARRRHSSSIPVRSRHSNSSVSYSQVRLPSYVWTKFNEGAMDEMMLTLGINKKDEGIATKMAMVALQCIHHLPQERPVMSSVVKMLEGKVVIDRPLDPFRPPTPPVRFDLPQNVGGNTLYASSGSSNWITPFSRDYSHASSASPNWITPLSREDYIFRG